MLHQLSHTLEDQRMSLDQYLMLMRKSRDEYLKEIEPAAEERVKRQLVLDEVRKREGIEVSPEEVDLLARIYAQAGQPIGRNEEQLRALISMLVRDKTLNRLVELAAGPEPGEESEESDEDTAEENALAAAEAGEEAAGEAEAAGEQTGEPEVTTPATDETAVDTGEEKQAEV
jgi:trigger factor